jgi:hypothetical protein
MAANISVVCYDLPTVSRFFRSVALAVAMQQHTSIQWQTYRGSAVLNTIYAVMFWKEPPGWVEVQTGTRSAVERTTDQLHERFLLAWIAKVVEKGPVAGNAYVEQMVKVRQTARLGLMQVFHDAAEVNAEVLHQTNDAIAKLAAIRLGATVGVAVIGGAVGVLAVGAGAAGVSILGIEAGASAGVFGGVGLAFSTATSVIKNWDEGGKAQVVGIATEVGKYAVSETGGKAAEHRLVAALAQQGKSAQIIKSAEGVIRKFSERLASTAFGQKAKAKAAQRVTQSAAQIASEAAKAGKAASAARIAMAAGRSIPVVFAALDIYGAIQDYQETVGGN